MASKIAIEKIDCEGCRHLFVSLFVWGGFISFETQKLLIASKSYSYKILLFQYSMQTVSRSNVTLFTLSKKGRGL